MDRQICYQKQHGQGGSGGDANDGACGADLGGASHMQEIPCQRQTDTQLQQRFQHLRDGGRLHIALPLRVAPHTRQQADAEHGGGQRPHRSGGQGVIQETGKRVCLREHQHGADQTQQKEQPDGGGKDLALLIFQPLCVSLTGHAGDGKRKPRCGEGQQEVVNFIRGVKISFSRSAQNIGERDLVGRADELDDDHSRRQNGGAA